MNPRQEQLIHLARSQGPVSLDELAEKLKVSVQTVRRDVQQLAQTGQLVRFHGGVRAGATAENITYQQRETLNADAKVRIARAVAARIPNDCCLMLTVGTTTCAVARELRNHRGLRIVTNDMAIAQLLSVNRDTEVHICGGFVRARDHAVVGEAAVDFVKQFRFDTVILGVAGIEPDGSMRDYDYREVKVTEAAIAHSRQVWVVADASKFGRGAMVEVTRVSDIDALFTDAAPPAGFDKLFAATAVTVEVAGTH
ncbi:MAG: DeoR/GlpR transcriptional regulator [Ramlibacter sp.]|nr:DeoR/GlpR transcriptional regulator [Ramlibacter sp.]